MRNRSRVRAAASKVDNPVVRRNALKTGNHRHLTFGKTVDQFTAVNFLDARRAMGVVGRDRYLPAQARTGPRCPLPAG